jgi:hypothetical protein
MAKIKPAGEASVWFKGMRFRYPSWEKLETAAALLPPRHYDISGRSLELDNMDKDWDFCARFEITADETDTFNLSNFRKKF